MPFLVARKTEHDEISWVVRSTVRQLDDVVNICAFGTAALATDQRLTFTTTPLLHDLADFPPAVFLREPVDR